MADMPVAEQCQSCRPCPGRTRVAISQRPGTVYQGCGRDRDRCRASEVPRHVLVTRHATTPDRDPIPSCTITPNKIQNVRKERPRGAMRCEWSAEVDRQGDDGGAAGGGEVHAAERALGAAEQAVLEQVMRRLDPAAGDPAA